jgi:uncharacterized protein
LPLKGSGPPKVVLITGASAGLGAAVAREAATKGYTLALTARRGDRLERLVDEIAKHGVETLVIPAALDDPREPELIVAAVIACFGRLDVLINNAGMGLPSLFADSDPEHLRRQLEVNLVAPLLLARHALPYLIERRGMIINVGSAITSIPNPALGAYGASKAGLAYWSIALRRELMHKGVQVCLVEPGPVKTEFFDAFTRLGAEPGRYHPMLDAPAPWMSARVEVVARRIVRLIERPKRRLSVLKRFAWPWRLLGALLQVWPSLGDRAVASVVRHYDAIDPRMNPRTQDERRAAPTE